MINPARSFGLHPNGGKNSSVSIVFAGEAGNMSLKAGIRPTVGGVPPEFRIILNASDASLFNEGSPLIRIAVTPVVCNKCAIAGEEFLGDKGKSVAPVRRMLRLTVRYVKVSEDASRIRPKHLTRGGCKYLQRLRLRSLVGVLDPRAASN